MHSPFLDEPTTSLEAIATEQIAKDIVDASARSLNIEKLAQTISAG